MAKKNYMNIELAPKYVPKKSEPYMCPEHLAYFYRLLTSQKEEILQQNASALNYISNANKTNANITGDDLDIAISEQENTMTLRTAERANNLLAKINSALDRIENGLLDTVGRGSDGHALRLAQTAAAGGSGDDAHGDSPFG